MDATDQIILNILSTNAKASLKTLADACHLSTAAVHLRLKKLEDQAVLTGSRSEINLHQLGYQTQSFIGIYFDRANMYQPVKKALLAIDEVVECYYTTGNFSLLVKVICRDNQHLTEVLSGKLQRIDGVARTETFICLEQSFSRAVKF